MRFIVLSRDVPIRYKYILASDWPAWKNVDPDLFPPQKKSSDFEHTKNLGSLTTEKVNIIHAWIDL